MHHWVVRLSGCSTGPSGGRPADADGTEGRGHSRRSSRTSRPVHRRTKAPVVTRSRSRPDVGLPVLRPPCGSRRRPPGSRSFRRRGATRSRGSESDPRRPRRRVWRSGSGSPMLTAHAGHAELGQRMGPGGHVLKVRPEELGAPQRVQLPHVLEQASGCGQSLLNHCGEKSESRVGAGRVSAHRQRCRLGAPGRESAGREQADRPTCLNEADALQRFAGCATSEGGPRSRLGASCGDLVAPEPSDHRSRFPRPAWRTPAHISCSRVSVPVVVHTTTSLTSCHCSAATRESV